ncbi:hypothetical protein Xszus_00068 [Xenorhabdus szentirmaii]|uniref:Uncharacterized protein n=1 Tax=Xenorhabdus szentirmaii DSM 16338 TaxID=1427518 RepID=W1IZ17_9GAMM|nr:hypothetical protein Xsze_03960 [Xenorhabdus szentirmaii DSM 16338]PHM40409.1 hypothetical protein Xszus_00068 [Xenorhabdus szentirmaii]CDL83727.1 hypothetical protein XSR1_360011 [Xenorhabdus szentirmaii DSM 16338]
MTRFLLFASDDKPSGAANSGRNESGDSHEVSAFPLYQVAYF